MSDDVKTIDLKAIELKRERLQDIIHRARQLARLVEQDGRILSNNKEFLSSDAVMLTAEIEAAVFGWAKIELGRMEELMEKVDVP